MTIDCSFIGGPMDRMIGKCSSLPQLQVFVDKRTGDKIVYKRTDEVTYEYDIDMSKASQLTEDFSVEKWI